MAANNESAPEPVRFTDKRRVDPVSGEARQAEGEASAEDQAAAAGSATDPADPIQDPLNETAAIFDDLPVEDGQDDPNTPDPAESENLGGAGDPVSAEVEDILRGSEEEVLAEAAVNDKEPALDGNPEESDPNARETELHNDLQRLQAEYVNYRRRVERDRAADKDRAVGDLITELMPVLDDISAARQAGDLEDGPFAHIANRLETVLEQNGLTRLDEVGVEFDPNIHEALMSQPNEDVPADHVAVVLRAGYRHGDRLLRAAQVMVSSGPEGD